MRDQLIDHVRLALLFMAIFSGFLLWQAWRREHEPAPAAAEGSAQNQGLPQADLPAGMQQAASAPPGSRAPGEAASPGVAVMIELHTDVWRGRLAVQGADINYLELAGYKQHPRPDSPAVVMLEPQRPYVLETGLVSPDPIALPTHHDLYRLQDGVLQQGDTTQVAFVWERAGIQVEKSYRLQKGQYTAELTYLVHNATAQPIRLRQYGQLKRREGEPAQKRFVHTYNGGALYDGHYEKVPMKRLKDEELKRTARGGWVAMVQHYFVGAILPPAEENNQLYGRALSEEVGIMGFLGETKTIAPGGELILRQRVFLGPQLQDMLPKVAPGLERVVDYGYITLLAKPVFHILHWFYKLLGNWGWSIVAITFVLKLAFYKLTETQYRSMARMKHFAPRIAALRERYAEDRARLQQAMMELYRKEKFNPFGGCLPMLVQMPVFIALYWVLVESVELRQAPFIMWIKDLSEPDPYYLLPILFGISMLLQQRLAGTSNTMDPTQARIMQFMPIGLAIFFSFFPSGLVLYWLVSNVISITQQRWIESRMARHASHAAT